MRILKNKPLHRRTFLKGLGAAVALPLLDAMAPASFRSAFAADAAAATTTKATRLAFFYAPNGMVMQNWSPTKTGADFEITRILKPLENYRDQMVVVSRLMSHNGSAVGGGGGGSPRPGGALFCVGRHYGSG